MNETSEDTRPVHTSLRDLFAHVASSAAAAGEDVEALDKAWPATRYAIFMTPRSGSTFLAYLFRDTGMLGFPDEWMDFVRVEPDVRGVGAQDLDTYLRRILAKHAAPNGVSGIEVSVAQLLAGRQAGDLDAILDRSFRYFYLRRRNIVRQAMSMHVASRVGVFHSNEMDEAARARRDAVSYERDAIRQHVKALHDQELFWEREFGSRRIEPDRLYYEDIVARPDRVLRRFANVLGLPETPLPPAKDNEIKRLSTERDDEWEARFREEDAEFLDALLIHRPFVEQSIRTTG